MTQIKNTVLANKRCDNTDKEILELNKLSEQIIGLAFKIHNNLGPGFIEKIYEKAFVYELKKKKIKFINQALIKVKLHGFRAVASFSTGFRRA